MEAGAGAGMGDGAPMGDPSSTSNASDRTIVPSYTDRDSSVSAPQYTAPTRDPVPVSQVPAPKLITENPPPKSVQRSGSVKINPNTDVLRAVFDCDINKLENVLKSSTSQIDTADPMAGYTPLLLACETRNFDVGLKMAVMLVQSGANLECKSTGKGNTPVIQAATVGNLELIKYLDSVGANLKYTNYLNLNAVFLAAEGGHLGVIMYLHSRGVDIHQRGFLSKNQNLLPIHQAARSGNIATVEWFLNQGVPIDERANTMGTTPLYQAVENGKTDIVAYLISRGADVNLARTDGIFPLYMAAQKGYMEICKMLMDRGANPRQQWKKPTNTPISVARGQGHPSVADFLAKYKPNSPQPYVAYPPPSVAHPPPTNNSTPQVHYAYGQPQQPPPEQKKDDCILQ